MHDPGGCLNVFFMGAPKTGLEAGDSVRILSGKFKGKVAKVIETAKRKAPKNTEGKLVINVATVDVPAEHGGGNYTTAWSNLEELPRG